MGKIDATGISKANDNHRFIERWYPTRDKRVRGIDCGNALKIDVRLGKLRTDIFDVIGHPAEDRLGHGFEGMAT